MTLREYYEPYGWGGNLDLLKKSNQALEDLGCRITLTHDKTTDDGFQSS